MIRILKSIKWVMMVTGILTVLIGILIVRNPGGTVSTIIKIAGWILVVAGAVALLGYALDRKRGLASYADIVVGVLILACGIMFVVTPETFVRFIGIIFGILLLVHGCSQIATGFRNRKIQDEKWVVALLLGLLCFILALLIIINPFSTVATLMLIIGLSLIIDGLSAIIVAGRTGYVLNRYQKLLEAQAAKEREDQAAREREIQTEAWADTDHVEGADEH